MRNRDSIILSPRIFDEYCKIKYCKFKGRDDYQMLQYYLRCGVQLTKRQVIIYGWVQAEEKIFLLQKNYKPNQCKTRNLACKKVDDLRLTINGSDITHIKIII